MVNSNNKTFRQYVIAWFKPKNSDKNNIKGKTLDKPGKRLNIFRISSPISLRLSKKILEKLKFYKNKGKIDRKKQKNQSYAQVSSSNVKEIMKIKEN